MEKKKFKLILLIPIAILIMCFKCCTVIDSGEIGIKFHKWSSNEQDYGGVEGTCKGWLNNRPDRPRRS